MEQTTHENENPGIKEKVREFPSKETSQEPPNTTSVDIPNAVIINLNKGPLSIAVIELILIKLKTFGMVFVVNGDITNPHPTLLEIGAHLANSGKG